MSWIDKLYRTYESNVDAVDSGVYGEGDAVLLPICHTTQNAHIEITIDEDGHFRRASVIDKSDAPTIVPCSEGSSSRSGSKPVHHPFADKLQYIARDFVMFGGEVTSGFSKTPELPHKNYMIDLKAWCDSEHAHWKARAVLQYLEKGNVIADLVDQKVLHLASVGERSGLLLYEWESDEGKPKIFSLLTGKMDAKGNRAQWQAEAFVRWRVEKPGIVDSSTQTDKEFQQEWIAYYSSKKETEGLCLVSGRKTTLRVFKILCQVHRLRCFSSRPGKWIVS